MMRNYRWLLSAAAIVGLLGSISLARNDGKDTPKGKNDKKETVTSQKHKQKTVKVEKEAFKVDVSVKGIVEAEQQMGLSIKPEEWAQPLMVKKAVDHGTSVKKGDVLLEIDREKIDQAIRDLRLERNLSELAIRQAREELPIAEKSLPLDLAMTERAKKHADEDLKQFLEVDRALLVTEAEQMVKSATFYLESNREELKQLQKMYRDKDLTEETEEFILKRQRFSVEMSEQMLKSSKILRDEIVKVQLPRREQSLRDTAEKQSLTLERTKNTMRPIISQKRLSLEKLIYDHDKSGERLANLEREREMMMVRAPADGIVYYGRCVRGQWGTTAAEEAKLKPGGMIQPAEVFMTVVSQRPVFVRADVEEKHLHLLREGLKGKIVLAGFPDRKIPARLLNVSYVPQTAGHFDARIALESSKETPHLMPGMACNVKLTVYHKKDALTVPASAVFTDDGDEDVHYVYLPGGKGSKAVKRTVKIGKRTDKKMEILSGLKEGEEILAENPDGKSSAASADVSSTEEN